MKIGEKLEDTRRILQAVRRRPLRTLGLLLLILLVIVFVNALVSFSGEKAKQFANLPETTELEDVLRLTYYRVESAEVLSHFLSGKTFLSYGELEAAPFIVKNRVYDDLLELISLIPRGEPLRDYYNVELQALNQGQTVDRLTLSQSRVDRDGELILPQDKESEQRQYLRFVEGIGAVRPATTTGPYDPQEVLRRLRSDSVWMLDYVDIGNRMYGVEKPEIYSYFFVGFAITTDLVDQSADPITQRVAQMNPDKADLGIEKVYFLHGDYHGHIAVRELFLLYLDLENISDAPFNLSSLKIHELESDLFLLQTEQELTQALVGEDDSAIYHPPIEKLLPGEHLAIPLRIGLGISRTPSRTQWYYEEKVIEESTFPETNISWWRQRGSPEVAVPIARRFSDDGDLEISTERISIEVLARKKDLRSLFTDSYYLGASIHVTELAGSSTGARPGRMQVRHYDPTNVVFRGSDEVGSCPILYAKVSGFWERIGPVFPFAVGRNFASDFVVPLPTGTTRVKLVEEEAERSFIDGVILRGGSGSRVLASHSALRELLAIDDDYAVLNPGDELEFELPAPAESGMDLLIRGYYLSFVKNE